MKKMAGYKELDEDFKENLEESELVDIFNELNDVDRSILITYISNNYEYTKTAKQLNVGVQTIKQQINEIRDKIKNRYGKI